ncbi:MULTISPECIES: hypothetical protein [unclassified Nonomuraea]|uniref:hypothetical protein n=1 Tax=unclassified Nonomuraea TaxID=2593643 RepID=UPI003402B0BF
MWRLEAMLRDALAAAGRAGQVRDDVPTDELVMFCLYALEAATELPSEVAAQRPFEIGSW